MPKTITVPDGVEVEDSGVTADGEGGYYRSVIVRDGQSRIDIWATRAPRRKHGRWHFLPEIDAEDAHEGQCNIGGCHEDELRRLAQLFTIAIDAVTTGLDVVPAPEVSHG